MDKNTKGVTNMTRKMIGNLTENREKPRFQFAAVLALPVLIVLLVVPLPAALLDILLVVYWVLTLLVLINTLLKRKKKTAPLLPSGLLIGAVYGLSLFISSVRSTVGLILTKGSTFDSDIIRPLVNFIFRFENTGDFFILLLILTGTIVPIMISIRGSAKISNATAKYMLDKLSCDFFSALEGAVKFIGGTVKMEILLLCLGIIGSIIQATVPYIYYLSIGFVLFQIPNLFMLITVRIITVRNLDKAHQEQQT
jgi:flagellar biosynthesis protein FlhA